MSRAKSGTRARSSQPDGDVERSRPTFPYTTRPNGLRKFLEQVPKRPRPTKVNAQLLASWQLGGGENQTIVRVLKSVGLVTSDNQPTDQYTGFMRAGSGPAVLGAQVRQVYARLFDASLEPHKETTDALRNLFNIHSGGSPNTIDLQIQTFKALCDHSTFDSSANTGAAPSSASSTAQSGSGVASTSAATSTNAATVHIDLHIHLPEGKTSREYEYIIQDIAKFIYGRDVSGGSRE